MDKNLEKISALYDGELSQNEMQEIIKKMDSDESMRNAFYKFGLISELMQRHSEQQKSKITYLQNYYRKLNPLFTNLVTAAATVLLTLIVLYQFDDDRFKVDKETSFRLSSAISSDKRSIRFFHAQSLSKIIINFTNSYTKVTSSNASIINNLACHFHSNIYWYCKS